jgi:hypothetical protein
MVVPLHRPTASLGAAGAVSRTRRCRRGAAVAQSTPERMGPTAEGTASARCRAGGCAAAEPEEEQEGRGARRPARSGGGEEAACGNGIWEEPQEGCAAVAGRKRIRVRVKRVGLYT